MIQFYLMCSIINVLLVLIPDMHEKHFKLGNLMALIEAIILGPFLLFYGIIDIFFDLAYDIDIDELIIFSKKD